jgi:3-oxoacyl-[acyl-carrier-protein] synthase II
MKDIYIVDYVVIDTLGSDVETNYSNMTQLAKGPQTITRYDITQYPNVLSTKGYEMSSYERDNLLIRLQDDLIKQISSRNVFPTETSVMFGAFATSGGYSIRTEFHGALEAGSTRFSPIRLFHNNNDLLGAIIAKKLKLEGLNASVNAACSSSMYNLLFAYTTIQTGMTNSILVGGLETPLHAHTQYYWQCTSAISTKNGGICKPFDKSRDGFLQAEGGSLWWICDEDTVKKYNLKPKAKLLSIAASSKCYDTASITAHDKTCTNQIDVINQALRLANRSVSDISFYNAHATSTPVGDDIEFEVFQKVFGDLDVPCVSFKGYIGHTMSACGLIESAYGLEAVKQSVIQPNYDLTDPLSDDERLITETQRIKGNTFIKSSFGFGGRSVVAIFETL